MTQMDPGFFGLPTCKRLASGIELPLSKNVNSCCTEIFDTAAALVQFSATLALWFASLKESV